ncbi:glycosyl hydrolase family 8 [Parvularcula dongshanensis]|uniref:cellulase n=1 Tax=Parvularcula dongshanensis TaxID=1173995 RepID=A0A840I0L1_9PROT|nr:glycosyl hydrolase family 8 [Parvularcula dongshanensis]MBB4658257.1 oligosaccharide reducing-end xylanase [Parvularcula dongshanensis]
MPTLPRLKTSLRGLLCGLVGTTALGAAHAQSVTPGNATPPREGAVESGQYRSLFYEIGKTPIEIADKLRYAYYVYFEDPNVSTTDPANGTNRLYFDYDADEAYILNPKTYDGANPVDVRSEGQSYGMMITVQMNDQARFDKLWRFAYERMLYKSGPWEGYFCWKFNPLPIGANQGSCVGNTPAPDGEVYFAAALYIAHARWGSEAGTGPKNYKYWADEITREMLHQEEDNGGRVDGVTNIIDRATNQIVFVPYYSSAEHTDPSYHLPHFFELFAQRGPVADRQRWAAVAKTSRDYLNRLRQKNPRTCLSPEYATFSADPYQSPYNAESTLHVADAWRVAGNVGMDTYWWAEDPRQALHANCLLDFFYDANRGGGGLENGGAYFQRYALDGTPLERNYPRWGGQQGMNAAAVLAARVPNGDWPYAFVEDLWNAGPPTGGDRYYSGMLYMLGTLSASGMYRAY